MTNSVSVGTNLKPVIDVDSQIDVLRSHGVSFKRCDEQKAKEFLTSNTYFFKLKAFDKEFKRDSAGNYINLDFGDLKDISTIDFHIRMFVALLTSEIEHGIKTRFNSLLMQSPDIEGYELVRKFEQSEKRFFGGWDPPRSYCLAQRLNRTPYNESLIDKYSVTPPPWIIWEAATYVDNIAFYKFFLDLTKYKDVLYGILDGTRKLRNAAAHHNCVLTAPAYRLQPTTGLRPLLDELLYEDTDQEKNTKSLAMSDPLVHDFSCIICAHINLFQNGRMLSEAKKTADKLKKRISHSQHFYKGETHLSQQLDSMVCLITKFSNFDRLQNRQLTRKPYISGKRHKKPRSNKKLNVGS